MQEEELSISKFSQLSTINTGTLSRILKGLKPISLGQLQRITSGMKLPEDGLFQEYIEECFASSSNLRRIRPFIIRCAELGRLDCIEEVVGKLLEDRQYNIALFDIAELLFKQEKLQAAALIYSQVAESERYQHSERLALCRYRLFNLRLGENLEENLAAATQFELYTNRLPEMEQLDALKQLMHIFGMVHKWSKVESLAVQLQQLASSLYHLKNESHRLEEVQATQPLYYYILYAYLARATVHEHYGDYNMALKFVALYADGEHWIREQDEMAARIIAQFTEWATINTLLYRLMSGELEVLEEYVSYVAVHEDEIFIAMCHIIQVANMHRINVDDIAEKFSGYIPYQVEDIIAGAYQRDIIKEAHARFYKDFAVYFFNQKQNFTKALEYLLASLELSVRINSEKNILVCFTLFEKYREYASTDAKLKFKTLSSEVHEINEKKNLLLFDSV
ncbi:transcriptional regulator [Paenibacillus senegalimassiliensis]|uniref:transcriptional regulator n=1 Tax=Paenibacillus senegalimassiliensis TaxID=1737426 RepID=UPI0011DC9C9A|nr:transcriptional regulator [Paenibacillus senegalimassiliensis]